MMDGYLPACLLRIHITESDRYAGKPLHEAIVAKCRELDLAGATVFRGLEGYGGTAEIHRSHLLRHDLPLVIQIVDSAEKIERALPALEAMMGVGVIAMSPVSIRRVEKSKARPL